MQVDVLVPLSSSAVAALGAVWVGYLSRGRRVRTNISGPLLMMSEHCGQIRGAAVAARTDCERTLERLRRGLSPERTAEQRDRLFEEVRVGEVLVDEYRFDLARFDRAIGHYRGRIRTVGEKLDELARTDSAGQGSRERGLADAHQGLRALETLLKGIDGHVEQARRDYLHRQVSELPPRLARRLHMRATKRYTGEARRAQDEMIRLLPELSDGQWLQGDGAVPTRPEPVPGGDATAAAGEAPPCGYCIWRCPHAPAGSGALGG